MRSNRVTFEKMIEILREAYAAKHKRRGKKPKLCIEEMLLAIMEYLREYYIALFDIKSTIG
jgi:hypothetical protein